MSDQHLAGPSLSGASCERLRRERKGGRISGEVLSRMRQKLYPQWLRAAWSTSSNTSVYSGIVEDGWYQLRSPLRHVAAYSWVVVLKNDMIVEGRGRAGTSAKSRTTFADGGDNFDSGGLLQAAPRDDVGLCIAPGSRVVVKDCQFLRTDQDGTNNHAYQHDGGTLVDDLMWPTEDHDDIIIVERTTLRPHALGGRCFAEVGDRVETTRGVAPYRRGVVDGVRVDGDQRLASLISDAGEVVEVPLGDLQRRILAGDEVEVVGGRFAGLTGIVQRCIALSSNMLERTGCVGAFEVAVTGTTMSGDTRNEGVVQVLSQDLEWIGVPRQDDGTRDGENRWEPAWLSDSRLLYKRVDVCVVEGNDAGQPMVSSGFVEMTRPLGKTNACVAVQPDDGTRRRLISVDMVRPMRYCMDQRRGAFVHVADMATRVIIIGPDCVGSMSEIGQYGYVEPGKELGVKVRLQKATQKDSPRTRFY
ncbi:hypothetical protein HMN09_00186600 [Mycena chlorophos]|uniref:KOW domain-containing protein n=1 Tax=Mycena chlorophos TaxID=658473 RepID=A0A8H6TQK4_MYCCL|nr:hypothetical protein HMN09_00186600 [Mycena chlorophos]